MFIFCLPRIRQSNIKDVSFEIKAGAENSHFVGQMALENHAN
jgi:hypothetical protein